MRPVDLVPSLLRHKFISLVGGGGKTSFSELLARAALKDGRRVAITTTTKIWAREPCATLDGVRSADPGKFLRIGKGIEHGKLTGLDPEEVRELGKQYDIVLVEADGAKGGPLKYPAAYEPIIPPCSDLTVVVAGLDALGGTVEAHVFRWALFTGVSGLPKEAEITVPVFLRLFEADGLMKDVNRAVSLILLNKYDACPRPESVPDLLRALSARNDPGLVVVASVNRGEFYTLPA